MLYRKSVQCPVCQEYLGYLVKDEVCSFVCKECQWIFTWNRRGEMTPPIKVETRKSKKCTCGGCQMRDSK